MITTYEITVVCNNRRCDNRDREIMIEAERARMLTGQPVKNFDYPVFVTPERYICGGCGMSMHVELQVPEYTEQI